MGAGAAFLALLKAIPPLYKMFQEAVDIYYDEMAAREERDVSERGRQRDALLAAIKRPGLSHEERDTIRRMLYALRRG